MKTTTNFILTSDSYKYSHDKQLPPGTTYMSSYIEARGTRIPEVSEVTMFGLQSFIKEHLLRPITAAEVRQAAMVMAAHGEPFNFDGWMRIVDLHGGYLPIKIEAVPEGTPVPLKNLMVNITNTDPELPWITSFAETSILRAVWYGSTVSTISRHCKKIIKKYLDKTSDNPESEINFKLHDFGYRGVSSAESGAIGGAAHLVNFLGTDTVGGICHAMDYYDADVCGFSIPASEHSTMTSWGRDNEFKAYENMVEQYAKPGAIFAVVSDSYDIYNAVKTHWVAGGLLDRVKAAGATVVIRPDSGDPTQVPIEIIEMLMDLVGYTTNSKGYRILPDHVRVIQGDGITFDTLELILKNMEAKGLSASNIAFGMGAGLLQKCDRDTFKFAMKCSAAIIDGKTVGVFKDPITDPGKRSKTGFLALLKNINTGEIKTVPNTSPEYQNTKDVNREWVPMTRAVYSASAGKVETSFQNFDDVRFLARI